CLLLLRFGEARSLEEPMMRREGRLVPTGFAAKKGFGDASLGGARPCSAQRHQHWFGLRSFKDRIKHAVTAICDVFNTIGCATPQHPTLRVIAAPRPEARKINDQV